MNEENELLDDQITEPAIMMLKPSLLTRIKSSLIDSVILILLMYLASLVIGSFEQVPNYVRMISFILIWLYEPIFVTLGQTLGQKLTGLKVSHFDKSDFGKQRSKVKFHHSLIRYLFKIILGWISLLTIHRDPYGRAIHDKLSKTVMVEK